MGKIWLRLFSQLFTVLLKFESVIKKHIASGTLSTLNVNFSNHEFGTIVIICAWDYNED